MHVCNSGTSSFAILLTNQQCPSIYTHPQSFSSEDERRCYIFSCALIFSVISHEQWMPGNASSILSMQVTQENSSEATKMAFSDGVEYQLAVATFRSLQALVHHPTYLPLTRHLLALSQAQASSLSGLQQFPPMAACVCSKHVLVPTRDVDFMCKIR